jgi:hypothetical protein
VSERNVVPDRVLRLIEDSRGADRVRVSACTDAEVDLKMKRFLETSRKKNNSHASVAHHHA